MEQTLEQKAQDMADGLGIPFYITADGRITQNGPGREVRPRDSAKPIPHEVEEVKMLKGILPD